jgi:hypothetical protein
MGGQVIVHRGGGGGGGAAAPFADDSALVKDHADATKLLRFEIGGFTTGNTRVLTPPDQNGTLAVLEKAQTFTETQTVTGTIIARQSGGVAGTDEVQISHNGTKSLVESKDGNLELKMPQVLSLIGTAADLVDITFNDSITGANIRYENRVGVVFDAGLPEVQFCNGAASPLKVNRDRTILQSRTAGIVPVTITGKENHTVPILRLASDATNDDPQYDIYQGRAATTDATVTTLNTIAIAASKTYLIEARVVARRTGGTAGTADDGAAYIRRAVYKTAAGVVTLIGSVQDGLTSESVAGWDCTLDISGTNVRVRVTGAVDTNITWHSTVKVQEVGT